MEPTFVDMPALDVVGLAYFGQNDAGQIPALWEKFIPREDDVPHGLADYFGICRETDENGIRYLAGRQVSAVVPELPAGMEAWSLAPQTYAAFPCTLDTIRETYDFAFNTWLPGSDFGHILRPDFEYYGPEFDGKTGDGLYIYIPVAPK